MPFDRRAGVTSAPGPTGRPQDGVRRDGPDPVGSADVPTGPAHGGPPTGDVPKVTYAQNFEDVRLWKALHDAPERLYVDVGAAHPIDLSVTKVFSDRGWRGINVEPGPNFEMLVSARPGDVNIRAAVAGHDGVAPFHITRPYPDLSSLYWEPIESGATQVSSVETVEVPTLRLETIIAAHVGAEPVGFLKVDVEGAELDVLTSADWSTFRPVAVVVEAISPGRHGQSHRAWEPVLLDAGYELACDDGINRFYARRDRPDVRSRLAMPVSALDGFVPWPTVKADQEVLETKAALRRTARELESSDALGLAHRIEIEDMTRELLDRDRALKEVSVERDRLAGEVRLRDDVNHVLLVEARTSAHRLAVVNSSWTMRVGRRVVGCARPFARVVRPVADVALGLVRRRRSRPRRVRDEYRIATAAGMPLQSTPSIQSAGDRWPDVAATGHPLELAWREIAGPRRRSPRLLDDAELRGLEALAGGLDVAPLPLRMLAGLRAPQAPDPAGRGPRSALLIDVRAAQIPVECGIRTHARHVLGEALDAVPRGVRVMYLADPALPPLPADTLRRFEGAWDGAFTDEYGALLQLAPLPPSADPMYERLVASPWIVKASVWLDAIPAFAPAAFLTDWDLFFTYQLSLESIARFDWLLAISRSSADELAELGVVRPRVVVTGCRSSIEGDPPARHAAAPPFDTYVVALGNGLAHKNVAAAVAGFAAVQARRERDLGMVVIANVSDAQEVAIATLCIRLGLDPGRVVVRRRVPADEFASLLAGAEAAVIPSFHEGFSIPVLEATQLGTPVVLSDIAAHRELLGHDIWSFAPEDPTTLAEALAAVLRDPPGVLDRQRSRLTRTYDGGALKRAVGELVGRLCAPLRGQPPRSLPGASSTTGGTTRTGGMSLSKICELEDFADPRLTTHLRSVFAHEIARFGPDFPRGHEYRKYWEVGMAVLAFDAGGLLDGRREFLGIGAGNEPTIFHLTRHAARVVATDLYLHDGWEESAHSSMMSDPGLHWPMRWRPERLRVRHMDALSLDVDDESFAGVFSSSSIEHFGSRSDIDRALDEIYRVLEPGGVASISSEYRLTGERPGIPGAILFDRDDIDSLFIGERDWSLMEPFDETVSAPTLGTARSFDELAADQRVQVERLGGLWTHHITYRRYPHLVLRHGDWTFTSFHLALRKGAGRSPAAGRRTDRGSSPRTGSSPPAPVRNGVADVDGARIHPV